MPDDSPTPEIGSVIAGKYRVVRNIGEGGMGIVVEAENTLTGKRVAVKWMRPEVAGVPGVESRFRREARACARVQHPNVVEVYDLVAEANNLFIVMELLDGESLRAFLDRGRVSAREVVSLLIDAMRGLSAAHKQGVIHRDIKPENIFLAKQADGVTRVVKVLDFGISKLVEDEESIVLTRTGAGLGTVGYMSREQIDGANDLDARTDVYAFGVMLYEALTGRLPYPATTLTELILQLEQPPPRLRTLRPDIPRAIDELVVRAIAADREQRMQSLDVLIAGLARYVPRAAFTPGQLLRPAPMRHLAARERVAPQWDSPPSLLMSVVRQTKADLWNSSVAVIEAVTDLLEFSARLLGKLALLIVRIPIAYLSVQEEHEESVRRTAADVMRLGISLLRTVVNLSGGVLKLFYSAAQFGLVLALFALCGFSIWWRSRGEHAAIAFMANPRRRRLAGLAVISSFVVGALWLRSSSEGSELTTTVVQASTQAPSAASRPDARQTTVANYLFAHEAEARECSRLAAAPDTQPSQAHPDLDGAPVNPKAESDPAKLASLAAPATSAADSSPSPTRRSHRRAAVASRKPALAAQLEAAPQPDPQLEGGPVE
jgi:serine/threonine protein kinase